jgi:calcium-translocating P-type ATPase
VALLAAGLGVLFFALGQSLGLSFWANFIFAIGIIVANVPEGLLPTVTLALAMGGQRMARRNALIRHLPSVETLGATTVICTDKTGTLTLNRLRVRKLFVDGAIVDADGDTLASPARALLFEAAAHCHTLKRADVNGARRWLGDPLEAALAGYAHARAPEIAPREKIDELPFDSDRRRMSTLHRAASGAVLYTKGALESVLPLCRDVHIDGRLEPCDAGHQRALRAAEETLALDGLRVIALAYRNVPDGTPPGRFESELTLLGLAALEDPPRAEVPRAIAQCHEAGIRVIMVTGDHPRTALAVARQVGLVRGADARVIRGDQLAHMTETELQIALNHSELVFARIAADQKRRIVAALKRKNEIVAVTGDGVNDAPALREAHIGIAMGIAGTDVAKESADMVLLDDNFASIVAAIEEGRAVFDNIRKFLTYILTSNIPEIVPYLAFVLFRIPLPLTIIQILAVDLGTDMVPALALGAEAPDPEVMKRPPRRRNQRLVDTRLILRAYLWLGLFEAAAAMAAFFFVLHAGGWSYGEMLAANDPLYLQATTACLAAIVVMQIVNVWLCRSDHASVVRFGVFGNPLILLGIGVELGVVALIAYTPWGNALFGAAPLDPAFLLFALPFGVVMLVAEEIRKAIVRRRASVTLGR